MLIFFSEHESELTHIYYGKRLLPFLKHYHLKKQVWQEFINRPAEQQLLEEAATFFAQWYQFQENISYSYVQTELDNIVQQAMNDLRSTHPTHPIFSTPPEQFSLWKNNDIDENQWNESNGKQILHTLCKVFKLRFHPVACSKNINFLQEYLFINYVSHKS